MNIIIFAVQAWKGTVTEIEPEDGTAWRIDNKCYNGQLYSCQCLELGIIMRYLRYTDPTIDISLNGMYLPACISEPECSTDPSVCPYLLDPESTTICSLYYQLVTLQSEANQTTLGIQEVTCPYLDNPTSANLLCQLWCQVEEFSGNNCQDISSTIPISSTASSETTSGPCPFDSYTNKDVLCPLWTELKAALDAIPTSTEASSTGTFSTAESNIQVPYSTCPHINLTDGDLACQMWCSLQDLSFDVLCIGGPLCPYESYTSPHNTEICLLWTENVNLKFLLFGINTTSTGTMAPTEMTPLFGLSTDGSNIVSCVYDGYPYMTDYCSLWCENQMLKYGIICSETSTSSSSSATVFSSSSMEISSTSSDASSSPSTNEPLCPYEAFVESVLLCKLYNSIEAAKLYSSITTSSSSLLSSSFSSSTASSGITTSAPPDGFYTGTFNETECPYLGLTNGTLICSLWCELLGLSTGLSCGIVTPISPVSNNTIL